MLHYQQGISTADSVRWRLRRGLQLLKESLQRDQNGPDVSCPQQRVAANRGVVEVRPGATTRIDVALEPR